MFNILAFDFNYFGPMEINSQMEISARYLALNLGK